MITLEELKNKLIIEYKLQVDNTTCGFSSISNNDLLKKFYAKMAENPNKVKEIELNIANGEEFRIYFSEPNAMREFVELHNSDPDKFYRILHKEELFLNTCLKTFGFDYLISLDPNKILNDIDNLLSDEDI